jgi:hypothetical protein
MNYVREQQTFEDLQSHQARVRYLERSTKILDDATDKIDRHIGEDLEKIFKEGLATRKHIYEAVERQGELKEAGWPIGADGSLPPRKSVLYDRFIE